MCRSAYMHIRNIGQIRKFLNKKATESIIHAFVTSRIDNGNSLFYGLPQNQINRLQRIQNTAARVLLRIGKYDHLSEHLFELHWLPVKARIEFKLMLLTYKCMNNQAPVYLKELLTSYETNRDLRSSNRELLKTPKTKLKTCGDRAFSKAAAVLWNDIPHDIRSSDSLTEFKRRLKIFLFKRHYNFIS